MFCFKFLPECKDFLGGSDHKESTHNAGDLGSILAWEDPLDLQILMFYLSLFFFFFLYFLLLNSTGHELENSSYNENSCFLSEIIYY